jgi:hypothetical protein
MVMQWTVNPPPFGTPGSIPGYSTILKHIRSATVLGGGVIVLVSVFQYGKESC